MSEPLVYISATQDYLHNHSEVEPGVRTIRDISESFRHNDDAAMTDNKFLSYLLVSLSAFSWRAFKTERTLTPFESLSFIL